ncbi:hypothetical protein SKAU_G00099030 [Synaphobranchus kaupii]|uniref:Uncharacterized protein n=1 Tax=Synaphobranchus kaupii TaxID=118154 RepID=A0A9Q1FY60_SYNKA|nr:hypothetical protein SKAU_G00099030 [Synaphobranchus kaupii]
MCPVSRWPLLFQLAGRSCHHLEAPCFCSCKILPLLLQRRTTEKPICSRLSPPRDTPPTSAPICQMSSLAFPLSIEMRLALLSCLSVTGNELWNNRQLLKTRFVSQRDLSRAENCLPNGVWVNCNFYLESMSF